ncbi:hypothetical protein RUM43_013165 [Polyplax serrata]|uniref:Uncharacterized protein n=1 Tax=Polyplax serrata TaxID=468196 RepID=A0AAN8P2D6_POLSC
MEDKNQGLYPGREKDGDGKKVAGLFCPSAFAGDVRLGSGKTPSLQTHTQPEASKDNGNSAEINKVTRGKEQKTEAFPCRKKGNCRS